MGNSNPSNSKSNWTQDLFNNLFLFIIIFLECILFMCQTESFADQYPEEILGAFKAVIAVNALFIYSWAERLVVDSQILFNR